MAIFGVLEYNGKSSDDFDLICCSVDDNSQETPILAEREILKGETTQNRPIANHYGTKFDDVITFDITFIKRGGKIFSREEVREINAWLTSPKIPSLLTIGDEDDPVYHFGIFTAVASIYTIGIAALTYTFTSNAPYGWSKKYEYTYNSTGSTSFILRNDSDDLNDPVYPSVLIQGSQGENITLTNLTEIEEFSLTLPCDQLYINSKYHQIYRYYADKKVIVSLADLGWDEEMQESIADGTKSIYWLRLLPGENKISVSGACEITFTYRVPVKAVY